MKNTNPTQTLTTAPVLPDPGVDVFIQSEESGLVLARLERNKKFFDCARFADKNLRKQIPVRDVKRWDYAVPAGDLLC